MNFFEMDLTGKVLIAANLTTIVLAILFQYDFGVIIWGYLIESIIIGLFVFLRMITTTIGKDIGTMVYSLFMSFFFLIHYGGFHSGYIFFLTMMPIFAIHDWNELILMVMVLGISHAFSFFKNKNDNEDITKQFFAPYSRILPMHLTIILSGFVMAAYPDMGTTAKTIILVIFMSLKTAADLTAHKQKHKLSDSSTN